MPTVSPTITVTDPQARAWAALATRAGHASLAYVGVVVKEMADRELARESHSTFNRTTLQKWEALEGNDAARNLIQAVLDGTINQSAIDAAAATITP